MRAHKTYLMWKAYADRGVAIQTNFKRRQASFESTPLAANASVVSYVDFERGQTGPGQVCSHVTTKASPYEDEREFRLLL